MPRQANKRSKAEKIGYSVIWRACWVEKSVFADGSEARSARDPGEFERFSNLGAFIDTLPSIVWQAGADGRVDYFNAAWYAFTGLEPHQSLGFEWLAALQPPDAARLRSFLAARPAQRLRSNVRFRNSAGSLRWFALDAEPLRDESGHLVGWIVMCTEIDELVCANETLRDSAARSQFLARAEHMMSRVLNPDQIVQAVADAAVESFADHCFFDVPDADGTLRRAAFAHRDPQLAERFATTCSAASPITHPVHPVAVAWSTGTTVYRPRITAPWQDEAGYRDEHLARVRAPRPGSLISTVVATLRHPYGVLTFCRSAPPEFHPDDVSTAEELARRVATAIENANLYAEARQTAETQRDIARRESFYASLGEALSQALDLGETLNAVVDLLIPSLADGALINLLDDHGDLIMAAVAHVDEAKRARLKGVVGRRYLDPAAPFGSPLVARTGTPMVYGGEERRTWIQRSAAYADLIDTMGLDSSLVVPIVYQGTIKGTLVALRGTTSRAWGNEDLPTFTEVARRISPAIGNAEAYDRERRVAQTFQNAALRIEMPQVAGFTFDAIYEAGNAEALVGGDWYDAFVVPDGRIVISIGDVVGSGLDAAVAMINVRQTIRGVAQIQPDPALMLQAADRTVRSQYPDRFVTAFAAVLDPITKQGAYANAGHMPALLRTPEGTVIALEARTLPLGLIGEAPIEVAHFGIEADCSLLLYTDGLVESERDLINGLERLRAVLAGESGRIGAARRMYEATLRGRSFDDVAILYVKSEFAGDLQRWRFDPFWRDAVQKVRREALEAVLASGIDAARSLDVELVLAELISNLLRYADGTVDLFLERNARSVVLHLLDKGPGFQFNPRLPADPMSETGRGLFLIADLADQFTVERRPGGGSHARIVLNLGAERSLEL